MSNFIRPKLSIAECRAILSADGREYTDKQIEEIRAFIMTLAEIDFNYFQKQMQKEKEKIKSS